MQPVAASGSPLLPDIMDGARRVTNWSASRSVFVGIDASLTATGIAVLCRGHMKTFVLAPPDKMRGAARLAWFRGEFTALCDRHRPRALATEGYAYGKQNNREALGELGGVLRLVAHDCRLPLMVVPPTSLKRFATGKGAGKKELVLKEAYRRWGIDVDDNNEADAAVVALMLQARLSNVVPLTAFQAQALAGINEILQPVA